MHLTSYLILELCRECNLGAIHARCPNRHADRYGKLPTDGPLTDNQIVSIAEAMYVKHGFRGLIGWHYYNEPLVTSDRMWRLMDRIVCKVPEATFTLWTNGTLLPADCSQFGRFAEIHVTDYHLPDHPIRNLAALVKVQPATRVHRWKLDDRLNGFGGEISYLPCRRMFMEFIVDYFGNTHLCCYDWQGRGSVGNVHSESIPELIRRWHAVRNSICWNLMDSNAPEACLKCKMRSLSIPRFVPEVAMDAERFLKDHEQCHA